MMGEVTWANRAKALGQLRGGKIEGNMHKNCRDKRPWDSREKDTELERVATLDLYFQFLIPDLHEAQLCSLS